MKEETVKESRWKEIEGDDPKPLSSHLKELRKRLIVVIVVLVVSFLICMNYAPDFINWFTDMGTKFGYEYVFIAPQELLMVTITAALAGAVIITFPVAAVELYQFAKPGLEKKEQRAFKFAMFFGSICFVIGVAFAWKISIPFMLNFLISFTNVTVVTASISIQEFMSFVGTVLLIFGIIFEMPLVCSVLAMLGILKPAFLIKGRKIAIVLIFLIAAIITPPDIASQIMVAVPMVILYQISIYLTKIFALRHEKKQAEAEAA